MQLGTVSFTLGNGEPVAFAVYSADDQSLDFYKRLDVPEAGDTFESKTITKVYTGIETDTYTSKSEVPWADHKADIVKIEAIDRIRPISMAYWFNMADIKNPRVIEADLSKVSTDVCKSMFCLFLKAKSLRRIDGLQNWDTSSCTTMQGAFLGCSALQSLDVSRWNTSNCTTMYAMFSDCLSLESLDLSGWDTSKVTNFRAMFAASENQHMKLRTVGNLSDWNTSNVTNMNAMFHGCEYLESIGNISGWNTSKVTNMGWLFNRCIRLNGIGDLSSWDTSNATDMSGMFDGCEYLENIGDISGWDTSKVANMGWLFNGCVRLDDIGNLSGWNTSSCTDMYAMFCDCLSLESLDVSSWNTSKVTTFTGMFARSANTYDKYNKYMKLKTVGNLSNWDISNATDMSAMFQGCEYLESIGNISGWNTSKVMSMSWLFKRCIRLNGIGDLSRWDVSHCTVFSWMFDNCATQEELDLSGWDISSVKDMSSIFDGMTGLRKISLPASWKWIGSTGTAGYLPTPSSDNNIPGADGKWYSVTTGQGYATADIPSGKADTYVASKELLPKVAFAVYSADDSSLDFYKRVLCDVPVVGDTFEGKTVTEVYTGIETTRYTPIDYNDSNGATNVPWYNHASDCKSVSVVDDGIKPINLAFWFHRFKNCISFDVSKLDTSSTSGIEHIFYDCENVTDLDLSTWDLSHCETAVSAFAYCYNLESIEFGSISTANFKPYGCYWMFSDCSKLSLDCSEWIIDKSAIKYAFNSGAPGVISPKTWK